MTDTAAPTPQFDLPGLERLDLQVTGMTCASCAARIEKRLNRMDGVEASVNYALGRARVEFDPVQVAVQDLVGAVEDAGYGAEPPPPTVAPEAADGGTDPGDGAAHRAGAAHDHGPTGDAGVAALRQRLVICTALAVPVVLVSMVPALQFRNWQWLGAGVVVIIAGFIALSMGSITLAPLLLVLGYCVLIPVGILLGPKRSSESPGTTEPTEGQAR